MQKYQQRSKDNSTNCKASTKRQHPWCYAFDVLAAFAFVFTSYAFAVCALASSACETFAFLVFAIGVA